MPFFDEVASNAWVPSQNAVAQRWQKKVAGFDGYIFVTAEYNHGIPAVLKNALDYAYPEWNKKAAGFVGYGSGGARVGARGRSSNYVLLPPNCNWRPFAPASTFRVQTSWRCGKTARSSRTSPICKPAQRTCWISWLGGPRHSRSRATRNSLPPRPEPKYVGPACHGIARKSLRKILPTFDFGTDSRNG